MRDRGTKCHNTRQKDPGLQKRPVTCSAPPLTQEHRGSQQWGEAPKPWYRMRTGQSPSPWASLPSPGLPNPELGQLLLLPQPHSMGKMLKYQQGGIHGRDDMQTETTQYYLQYEKWSLLSFGSSVCIQYSSREEKTLKHILPTSKPQAMDNLWKIKTSTEFPSQSINTN